MPLLQLQPVSAVSPSSSAAADVQRASNKTNNKDLLE